MVFTFWGSQVQPQATPSETCLPHQLKITKATLDPEKAAELPPGTRISVWAQQKMRPQRSGALQPVATKRSLVAVLVAAHRECVDTRCTFSNSSLVSFSISPQSHSCAVHLAGFFDDRSDSKPEEADDGSITWAELQELLANARGDEEAGKEMEQMRDQVAQATADTGEERNTAEVKQAGETSLVAGGRKRKVDSQKTKILDSNKQARLDAIRAEAERDETAFTSPISKHAKARTRKLAGGTQVADLVLGKGKVVKVGSRVTVSLVEQSANGKTFGERKKLDFVVGLKAVPSGLDRAVVGMREGAKALVSMEASSNDRPLSLPQWSQDRPLSVEVSVQKVA